MAHPPLCGVQEVDPILLKKGGGAEAFACFVMESSGGLRKTGGDAGILPFRDAKGNLITPEPWTVVSPASQWQAQFGLRVTFGRR